MYEEMIVKFQIKVNKYLKKYVKIYIIDII